MGATRKLTFNCLIAGIIYVSMQFPAQAQIFGKNEIKYADIKQFSKWNDVVRRHQDSLNIHNPQISAWENNIDIFKNRPTSFDKLEAVNSYVNKKISYKPDINIWNKSDYWATISESFAKGEGDCDDYAIAKYFTLREIGFKDEDMRIVVLKDTSIDQIHAVLSVNVNGKFYILDNQFEHVKADYQLTSYEPIYSINESNWWRHV